jgi:hypothetical protein
VLPNTLHIDQCRLCAAEGKVALVPIEKISGHMARHKKKTESPPKPLWKPVMATW